MPAELPANNIITFQPGDQVAVMIALPLDGPYDYRLPNDLWDKEFKASIGDFVTVPFRGREITGVIWGEGTASIDPKKLKTILHRYDCPPLPEVSRSFIKWVAKYTLQPCGAILKMTMSAPGALAPPKPIMAWALANPIPEVRMTAARQRVIDILSGNPPRPTTELAREAATSPGVVKGLADLGVVIPVSISPPMPADVPDPDKTGPDLSLAQKTAADQLISQVADKKFAVSLLDGVPGSGKTEVYFEGVATALGQGQQVLVLLPEIALGSQWLTRFRNRFGGNPHEWHSDLTPARRRQTWRAIAENKAKIIVGARSALFLPFVDLGLIIVDEEHDGSFKQEEGVIYNARDMAVVRAQLGKLPVVLASATPSLETYTNMISGRYQSLHLPDRHGGASLPGVTVINQLKTTPARGSWISPPLLEEITKTLERQEQVLLFLNRRGYAPLTLCRTCGHRFQCPHCTAWLVEHRKNRYPRLQCHHCGFNCALPNKCPSCESEDSLTACGPGIERMAEEVENLFPEARTVIVDSDNISGPAAASELVRRIENQEVDIILGTQMIAKGYHFPMLTTVGVIDGDLGLQGGDLRAAERTYQLLYQVAGRAGRNQGRNQLPGQVMIQSYMADHPVMEALKTGSRDQFLAAEGKAREQMLMPPYGRLAALIISSEDENAAAQVARDLGRSAPRGEGIVALGPAPAPFALLRGRHRHRMLLKTAKNKNIQEIIHRWLEGSSCPAKVRIQIDIDPYSFM